MNFRERMQPAYCIEIRFLPPAQPVAGVSGITRDGTGEHGERDEHGGRDQGAGSDHGDLDRILR